MASALVLAALGVAAGCSPAAGVTSTTTTTTVASHPPVTSRPALRWRWSRVLTLDGRGSASAVDCTSTRFCMVATTVGLTYRYEAGAWGRPEEAPPLGRVPAPVSLSCVRASFCMLTTVGGDGVDDWNGHSWTKTLIAGAHGLWALGCASPAFCVAVDGIGDAYYWDGSAFSAGDPDWGSQTAISCAGPGFCVAVAGGVSEWEGSGWSEPQTLGASAAMIGVSCPRERFCVVVDAGGQFLRFDGRAWTHAVLMTSAGGEVLGSHVELTDVSCASAHACFATGSNGQVFSWDGRAWSGPVEVSPGTPLTAVSCPTPRFCAAVGGRAVFMWKRA